MIRPVLLIAVITGVVAASSVRAENLSERACEAIDRIMSIIAVSTKVPFTIRSGSVDNIARRSRAVARANSEISQNRTLAAKAAYEIVSSSAPDLVSPSVDQRSRSSFAALFFILNTHAELSNSVAKVYRYLAEQHYSRTPADDAASAAVRTARLVLLANGFETLDRARVTLSERIVAAAADSLIRDAWSVSQAQFYYNEKYGDGISIKGINEVRGLIANAVDADGPKTCAGAGR